MQIVIDIPEKVYEMAQMVVKWSVDGVIDIPIEIIANGAVLTECKDAISRKAVLNYIDNMPSKLTADGRRMIRKITLEEYITHM